MEEISLTRRLLAICRRLFLDFSRKSLRGQWWRGNLSYPVAFHLMDYIVYQHCHVLGLDVFLLLCGIMDAQGSSAVTRRCFAGKCHGVFRGRRRCRISIVADATKHANADFLNFEYFISSEYFLSTQ